MQNIQFIGFSEQDAEEVVDVLIMVLPRDMMDEAVYKAYPDDAPVYAKTNKPAPYIIIRDSDLEQARQIKDALQKRVDFVNGPPDVEISIIEFHEGRGGEVHKDSKR